MRCALLLVLLLAGCDDAASPGASDAGRTPGVRDAARAFGDALPPADAAPPCGSQGSPHADGGCATPPGPDAAPPDCRLNSDCAPGLYCREGRCSFDCREARDCPPGARCESGQCRSGPECAADADCGAPARVCEAGACADGCAITGCAAGTRCDAGGGRCRPEDCGGCEPGFVCDREAARCVVDDCGGCPAGRRCRGGECVVEDCGGCPAGQRCQRITGQCVVEDCGGCVVGERCDPVAARCVPEDCGGCPAGQRCDVERVQCVLVGHGALGDPCARDAECDSGICLRVSIGGRPESACATLCCSETQCPQGFGCLYSSGARYCVPGRFNVAGDGFTRDGRQACGDNACRSGMCELRENGDRCLGACCTDNDCVAIGGGSCFFGQAGASMRSWCDLPASIIGGFPGEPCGYGFGPQECQSGICIASGLADPPGFCAGTCCTNAECGEQVCGQVVGFSGRPEDGIATACVPLPRGAAEEGAACADDAECQSGHCVENVCAEPCCFDFDCRGERRCRPRDNGEGTHVRVCWLER